MAVENDAANYFHTDSLVSKRGRRHYRVPVRSQHWQLRSLISAEQRHLVYFPGGTQTKQIQRLNTVTHECETIKMLNFAPRCLVANNGWLCCGSETGEFVAVQLDEGVDSDAVGGPMSLDPDALMDLGSNASREDSLLSLLAQSRRTSKNMSAKSLKITTDRINCITLWFPDLLVPAGVGAYKDPAAILADNKGNVSLVSLVDFEKKEQAEPLDVVKYPDYVNRAVVSPDGRMLIAILDDPYLYVHMREEKPADASSPTQTPQYEWKQRQRIFLTSQRKEDASDSRGSFAACFNSSGTILAVGTQHGTVSVFDAAALEDPDKDALMTTFKSSRPESGPGAIRDMSFCPGPFDILAWTEDRGHVGVADMRMKFASRQILDIGVDADFDHVNIFDRNTIDPRLLDAQAARRAGTLASPRRAGDGADSLNPPLSASETVVLEALQGDRQRRDRLNQRPDGTERSVPDLSWTYLSSLRPHTGEGEGSNRAGRRSASVTRVARGSSTSRAQRSALDEYLDQRERARNRAQGNASERLSAIRRSDPRWIDRLGETVAAMRDSQDRTDNSYLNVLDILQARERTTDNENEDSSLLVPLVNQVVNRWEESAVRGTLPTANAMALDHGVFEVPPSRDNTAGLAWSDDGRIMYVGAQDGIYEFHINTQSRKFHPGYSLC